MDAHSEHLTTDDVEVKPVLVDFPTAFSNIFLGVLYPDSLEIIVIQEVEDSLHMHVELFDGLFLKLLDARSEVFERILNVLPSSFEALTLV